MTRSATGSAWALVCADIYRTVIRTDLVIMVLHVLVIEVMVGKDRCMKGRTRVDTRRTRRKRIVLRAFVCKAGRRTGDGGSVVIHGAPAAACEEVAGLAASCESY